MAWRYLLQELPSRRILDPDLPLTGVEITDTLSGPGALSAAVPVEVARLVGGADFFKEWGAAIIAETDGQIRGYGIITNVDEQPYGVSLECVGFSGILQEQPYVGSGKVWTKVDPLDVVRFIWADWQAQPGGDLGVVVDSTTSPIRIGEEQYIPLHETAQSAGTTFDEGPIRLNWWDTHDLGGMIDDYVKAGYFDYHEQASWNASSTDVELRLRLYYPRKGARRSDLRFAFGENIAEPPQKEPTEHGWASQVMFLGAGEGRNKVQALSEADAARLRHLAVVTDDTIKRQTDAQNRARQEHAQRRGDRIVKRVTVRDHPNAPLGSWAVGDEVRVVGKVGWTEVDQWARIIESTISPESGDVATLSLEVR